ncbi:ATP-dependent dethiobiotin synthetase BioD, partial [Escherichia coli]|uniref:ATP-dependent dethiobiotin synthetase BioD n=1 Tax=Escherichia coli TaxID=562 RepID=UPI001FCE9224
MLKRFFITGTDTSVGKTVVSRALLQALASQGKTVAGYKPVAKGSKETPEGLRNKGVLRRNRRNFRYPSFKPATNVSRSI